MQMEDVRQKNNQQLLAGICLAIAWAIGLYSVLELDSLLAKNLVLMVLAPISLCLDHIISVLLSSKGSIMSGLQPQTICVMEQQLTPDRFDTTTR